MPPGTVAVKPMLVSAATSLRSRRSYLARMAAGMAGSPRAWAAASWTAANWPLSLLSFTSA